MFNSETLIPISTANAAELEQVAHESAEYFKELGYLVECSRISEDEWDVGIARGGIFKTAVGLKSAMKVRLAARPDGTMVTVRVGIFGKQAVPTAITVLVAWPVVFAQIWGIIHEAGLDGEAFRAVALSLGRVQGSRGPSGDGSDSGRPDSRP
jgi:hypothetical protein